MLQPSKNKKQILIIIQSTAVDFYYTTGTIGATGTQAAHPILEQQALLPCIP